MTTYVFPFGIGDEVWLLGRNTDEAGGAWKVTHGKATSVQRDANGGAVFAATPDGSTEVASFTHAFRDEVTARAYANALAALPCFERNALLDERARLLKEACGW